MTSDDADRIITEIFQKRWPNWELDSEEVKLWRAQLRRYEYEPTVGAINDFYMNVPTGRKPQAYKLAKAIKTATAPGENSENPPLHVYTIVKKSQIGTLIGRHGYDFAINRNDLPEYPNEMENQAEYARQRIQEQRGEEMVVLQQWGEYYDDGEGREPAERTESKQAERSQSCSGNFW